MNLLFRVRQSAKISDKESTYSVGYLGHVSTVYVRGGDSAAVERSVNVLWSRYIQRLSDAGVVVDPLPTGPLPGFTVDMKLTVCAGGLRTQTPDDVAYWSAHRLAHATWQRRRALFVWIYRHEPSKLQRVELRCHAVVCLSDAAAEAIASSLRQRIRAALREYTRERTRRHNSRLSRHHAVQLQRNNTSRSTATACGDPATPAVTDSIALPPTSPPPPPSQPPSSRSHMDSELMRIRLLRIGKHYKPPSSPTLTVIDELADENQDWPI